MKMTQDQKDFMRLGLLVKNFAKLESPERQWLLSRLEADHSKLKLKKKTKGTK